MRDIILVQEWVCSSSRTAAKPLFEFYWDATDHFSAYPRSLKRMFMSRENLGSSRTRRFRVEETR